MTKIYRLIFFLPIVFLGCTSNLVEEKKGASFDKFKINSDSERINNILRASGFYFAEINTKIVDNKNNSVEIIYNFNLGEIAKIQKIKFIGEKIFNDTILRNIIISEEAKFWKFLTRNKFLDIKRINTDVKRLNDFYKIRGFYNVKIKSTTAVITDLEWGKTTDQQ